MSDGLKLIAKLLEEGAVSGLRELDRDLFIDDEVDVFAYVRSHYRRFGELPDIATVMDETGQDLPETPENAEFYREKVADRQTYNQIKGPFGQLRLALSSSDIPAAREAISALQSTARVTSAQQDLRTLTEVAAGRLTHVTEQVNLRNGVSGIPTGWPMMDSRLGGYQNGDLITWAARPGMGKTYYLLHQAMAAYRAGFNVLFVSMEMTLDQLGNRLVGLVTGMNPRVIRDGMMSNRATARFTEGVQALQDEALPDEDGETRCGIFHMYAGNFHKNVEDVESLMLELMPDVVYIDGVYLMTTNTGFKRGGRYEGAADVFDYLKQMTIIHARPIVCTTKFAKGAGKDGAEGSLENIGYTDTVGTHSSIVIALKAGEAPYENVSRKAEVLKGREGEEGTYDLHFRFGPMCFDEVDEEHPLVGTGGNGQSRRNRQGGTAGSNGQEWTPNTEGED